MDGQAERTIQTFEDMLRPCIINFKGIRDTHLPLVEFSYNNNYHSSIPIAPFEALYGRDVDLQLIYKTLEKVHIIRNCLKTAYSRQKS